MITTKSKISYFGFNSNRKSTFQGQNPDGGQDKEGDFMSEAKDWAGELISGQTGTGRILVRLFIFLF